MRIPRRQDDKKHEMQIQLQQRACSQLCFRRNVHPPMRCPTKHKVAPGTLPFIVCTCHVPSNEQLSTAWTVHATNMHYRPWHMNTTLADHFRGTCLPFFSSLCNLVKLRASSRSLSLPHFCTCICGLHPSTNRQSWEAVYTDHGWRARR